MPCYTPLSAYKAQSVNPKTGKRPIVWQLRQGFHDLPIQLPCGRCVGCRLERSRQWAIRAMHEAQMHEHAEFVTLTYSDEALEKSGNYIRELRHQDFQDFMKRLREKIDRTTREQCEEYGMSEEDTEAVLKEGRLRYYMCGEYGEKFGRPHFHAIIYNLHLEDKQPWVKRRGHQLYISKFLTETWGHGHASTGSATFKSAAYIARYVMKKDLDPRTRSRTYERLDEYGEYVQIAPEYQQASRRPGLGKPWLEKFQGDVYPKDYFTLEGNRMRPPKYYDFQYEIENPDEMATIKANRRFAAKRFTDDNTRERLDARWYSQQLRAKKLKRNLDDET